MAHSLVVIGSGPWAQRHIATIANVKDLSLAGLVSRSLSMIPRPLFGNVEPSVVWHDVEGMLQSGIDVDGAVLAVPPPDMGRIAKRLLLAGIPVFAEKPLTLSATEANALAESAKRKNVLLMVNFIHLFSPGYERLKAELPKIMPLQHVEGRGGNKGPARNYMTALWDYGPHDLAFAFDLLGRDPDDLTARLLCGGRQKHIVQVSLRYPNAIAELRFGNLMRERKRWLQCAGSSGKLRLDDKTVPELMHGLRCIRINGPTPLEAALCAFVSGIKNSHDPLETADLAVRVNQCLEYIDNLLWGDDNER